MGLDLLITRVEDAIASIVVAFFFELLLKEALDVRSVLLGINDVRVELPLILQYGLLFWSFSSVALHVEHVLVVGCIVDALGPFVPPLTLSSIIGLTAWNFRQWIIWWAIKEWVLKANELVVLLGDLAMEGGELGMLDGFCFSGEQSHDYC